MIQEKDKENDISFPDLSNNGCEPEDKCCYCIPIKTGLTIVSIITVVYYLVYPTIVIIYYSFLFFNSKNEAEENNDVQLGIGFIVVTVIITFPGIISSWWLIKWMRNDSMETRNRLSLAIIITGCQPISYFLLEIGGSALFGKWNLSQKNNLWFIS